MYPRFNSGAISLSQCVSPNRPGRSPQTNQKATQGWPTTPDEGFAAAEHNTDAQQLSLISKLIQV